MGTSVIKCDGCGADMIYSPEKARLVCPYCSRERTVQKRFTHKRDFFQEKDFCEVDDQSISYACPNCGGEVVLESFVTATKCPFCGATNVVKKENLKGMKPDGIIPFKLSKENAYNSGKAWLKKRLYAHKKFKKEFKPDNVNGVYIPAFDFSATTFSTYTGTLGEHYYVTVGSGKNKHTEQRTRWFNIGGSHNRFFDDVMIESSKQLTQKEMNAILPYDTTDLEGYKAEYVAGFSAERYNENIDDCFDKAKCQMESIIKSEILLGYRYDVVGEFNLHTDYFPVTFNYVLLPLWVFGCKFKQKMYKFIVNGVTGRSYGKYPKSVPKILFTILLILGVIVGIVLLVMRSMGRI